MQSRESSTHMTSWDFQVMAGALQASPVKTGVRRADPADLWTSSYWLQLSKGTPGPEVPDYRRGILRVFVPTPKAYSAPPPEIRRRRNTVAKGVPGN